VLSQQDRYTPDDACGQHSPVKPIGAHRSCIPQFANSVGLNVGASMLSQQLRKFPLISGQHKPVVLPLARHLGCAPQCSSTVGLALGLAEGDAVGASVLSQQSKYDSPSFIGQQSSPAGKPNATHRSCIPQSADSVGLKVGLDVGASVLSQQLM